MMPVEEARPLPGTIALRKVVMRLFRDPVVPIVDDYCCTVKPAVRTRRNWKPNVQEKRLFSYIMDRHIRVKVTTHALRCIDKAGGIDEYLLKTPYHKMDTEMGLYWKTKIEKLYEELGQTEVAFFTPEEEAKLEQDFKDMKLAQRAARRELRRQMYGGSSKQKQIEQGSADTQETAEEAAKILSEGIPNEYAPEDLVANS